MLFTEVRWYAAGSLLGEETHKNVLPPTLKNSGSRVIDRALREDGNVLRRVYWLETPSSGQSAQIP